jgi:uracil-DNA glycosylase family 4
MPKEAIQYPSWDSLNAALLGCKQCERLVAWRETVGLKKRRAFFGEEYWAKPVPGFGDPDARVLVIGLAPGAHGSNRTGRMFTGDASGDFLFPALYESGFANQPQAGFHGDSLVLKDLFISAVCRCAPPENKPSPEEIQNCLPFLRAEIGLLKNLQGIVCLGKISFDQTMRYLLSSAEQRKKYEFKHLAQYTDEELPFWVLASYHPSRQNTQTGRLTREMFAAVWNQVRFMLNELPL